MMLLALALLFDVHIDLETLIELARKVRDL